MEGQRKEKLIMRTTGIEIDGNKLKKELLRRGLTMSEVSKEMGFNESYLSNHVTSGFTSLETVKMLESLYHIKYESYQPDRFEPEQYELIQPVQESKVDIDYGELEKIIYRAFYKALRDAWDEVID